MNPFKGRKAVFLSTILIAVLCAWNSISHTQTISPGVSMADALTHREKIASIESFLGISKELIGADSPEGRLAEVSIDILYDYLALELPAMVVESMLQGDE